MNEVRIRHYTARAEDSVTLTFWKPIADSTIIDKSTHLKSIITNILLHSLALTDLNAPILINRLYKLKSVYHPKIPVVFFPHLFI